MMGKPCSKRGTIVKNVRCPVFGLIKTLLKDRLALPELEDVMLRVDKREIVMIRIALDGLAHGAPMSSWHRGVSASMKSRWLKGF